MASRVSHIAACIADAAKFVANVKQVAAALSGDVLTILKVVVAQGTVLYCTVCTCQYTATLLSTGCD